MVVRFARGAAVSAGLLLMAGLGVQAQEVTIGVTLGATGQTASIGIPMKQGAEVLPQKIGDVTVRYIFLDDGGDPGVAVKNMRQLTEQNQADVILGSSSIPSCTAMAEVALQTKTPQICLSPSRTNAFSFAMAQPAALMVEGMVENMHAKGYKNIGYIGFADSLGEHNLSSMQKLMEPLGMKLVASERYNRTDTSVTAQVLKIVAAKPDAIFVSRDQASVVVGSTGSDDKAQWLRDEAGLDAVINYKTQNLATALEAATPKGIDVYFENVGGAHLDAALPRMNTYGRIPVCGMISTYNGGGEGVTGLFNMIYKRIRMQGFVATDFAHLNAQFASDMTEWLKSEKIKYQETILNGFERAPEGLIGLFEGRNSGKMLIHVAD